MSINRRVSILIIICLKLKFFIKHFFISFFKLIRNVNISKVLFIRNKINISKGVTRNKEQFFFLSENNGLFRNLINYIFLRKLIKKNFFIVYDSTKNKVPFFFKKAIIDLSDKKKIPIFKTKKYFVNVSDCLIPPDLCFFYEALQLKSKIKGPLDENYLFYPKRCINADGINIFHPTPDLSYLSSNLYSNTFVFFTSSLHDLLTQDNKIISFYSLALALSINNNSSIHNLLENVIQIDSSILTNKPACHLTDNDKKLRDRYLERNFKLTTCEYFNKPPNMGLYLSSDGIDKLVSIIIPTKNSLSILKTCIQSILKTRYKKYEIIIVDNNSNEDEVFLYYKELSKYKNIKVIFDKGDYNFSRLNNLGFRHSKGDVLCLMNNDIELTHDNWLDALLPFVLIENVGFIGPKLIYPDQTLQHIGTYVGNQIAYHVAKNKEKSFPGYLFRYHNIISSQSITAALSLIKRTDYINCNGFDEKNFPINFSDLDFSLRLLKKKKFHYVVPHVEAIHHESKTRGYDMFDNKLSLSNFRSLHYEYFSGSDPFFDMNEL